MKKIISKIVQKIIFHVNNRLFVKQWILGFARGDIKTIIRSKRFDLDITWMPLKSANRQYADPFIIGKSNGEYDLFIEDCTSEEHCGKISLLTIDRNFKPLDHKIILDTKSHLSYPFIFRENGRLYIFPEASQSGKLSCYEYDSSAKRLVFLKDLIELPLLDSNVIKYNSKYWISGAVRENGNGENYELRYFFADNLLGPYTSHQSNPIKTGLDGVRGAGDFIVVDNILYRPTQNCREEYGKSMTINRVNQLNETGIDEEFYMKIEIDKKNPCNAGMKTIHTINVADDIIVVDGIKWTFSPVSQHKELVEDKSYFKKLRKQELAGKA